MRALITSKNSPNVRIVTGKVNKINIGFTKKLSKAKTIATTIEVIKESTLTPPRKLASKVTKIAVTSNLTIKYILNIFKVKIYFDDKNCIVLSKKSVGFSA